MRKWLLAIGMVLGLSALAQGGKLEIFSWWAGDEGPALEALIRLYKLKTCTSRIPRINFHPLPPAAPDPGRGAPAG
ncbi:hypothetical protein TthSNM76_13230 [Thermus thermophilus]|nr:hypothetical protein TthSNM76_13230 [Thermus thermophilus]